MASARYPAGARSSPVLRTEIAIPTLALLLATGLPALAASDARHPSDAPILEIVYSAAMVGFVGDLSTETIRPGHQLDVSFLHRSNLDGRLYSCLTIEALVTDTTASGDFYSFPEGAALGVNAMLLVGHVCYTPEAPIRPCLGLGDGTVNVNAARFKHDLGTWNYHALISWHPWRDLYLQARVLVFG